MANIGILDCTLREGGYVNNWDFGCSNIKEIITNLTHANLEYIECGFLKQENHSSDTSIFSNISQLENLISDYNSDTTYTLMINYGEYDISLLPDCPKNNIGIRVAFKKDELTEALEYCARIKAKGYKLFINPMHSFSYSSSEFLDVILKVNKINPYALTIVDTTGSMKEKDILSLFYLADSNLDKNIALAFHSHNGQQLSFSNAQCLMKINGDRKLIIDSTVFGIGRGAGNICTELIAQYINDNYNGLYKIPNILQVVDDQIKPIYEENPWGYSVAYYLAATNNCHPNYAKFLNDKNLSAQILTEIFKQIPDNKKTNFDKELIEKLYNEICFCDVQ
jgi:4-hydroxy 2-oxovalerate aldolase